MAPSLRLASSPKCLPVSHRLHRLSGDTSCSRHRDRKAQEEELLWVPWEELRAQLSGAGLLGRALFPKV